MTTRFKTSCLADVAPIKEQAKILLITATDVETRALHAHFRPLHPHGRCSTISIASQTYYVGRLGKYGVIHVQCQMGSILPGGSGQTVAEAIAFWNVKAVVMVGIAFGVDRKKQRIGDVLVSKTVIPYEIKRVGKRHAVPRNPIPPAGPVLLNRFSNCQHWRHIVTRRQQARVIPAQLLSGESLIDNKKYRTALLTAFQQAEGGEMEGAGVFAAAHQSGVEWILVKGICDFADGQKSVGKKSKQATAAVSAASLCLHVFSQPGTFESFGCADLSDDGTRPRTDTLTMEEALFEIYEVAYERAYLKRSLDRDIAAVLSHQGLWVTGPSGCGKTNALRRNLLKAGMPFEFIDMSKCIGASVPEIFAALHIEIAERLGVSRVDGLSTASENGQSFHIGEIAKLIQKNVKNDTRFLVDEIPLAGNDFAAFSEGIAAIFITLANKGHRKSPLLIASIDNPKSTLQRFHKKLHERIRLLELPCWTEAEVRALLELVAKLVPLNLPARDKVKLVNAAHGCPRSLKLMLKTWCMFRKTTGWSIDRVISESNLV